MARANPECLRSYFSLINMVFFNLELGVSCVHKLSSVPGPDQHQLLDDGQAVWSNDGIVQMRLSIATACFISLPVPQLDIAVLASRALRALNLRQVCTRIASETPAFYVVISSTFFCCLDISSLDHGSCSDFSLCSYFS